MCKRKASGGVPVQMPAGRRDMSVVRPASAPTSLAPVDRRLALLREAGADDVHVLQFDEAMAAMPAADFIAAVLVDTLHVREVVVGEDFRFGHRAAGSVQPVPRASIQAR